MPLHLACPAAGQVKAVYKGGVNSEVAVVGAAVQVAVLMC
jgi:hypothetical protein